MKTTAIGRNAESAVAKFLQRDSYKILAKNWRTRVCEIDIVAQKNKVIYFIEVKYRSSVSQGSGFEYIGPAKLRQMEFAAQIWCQSFGWDGDYQLVGAEVTGIDFETIKLVEIT